MNHYVHRTSIGIPVNVLECSIDGCNNDLRGACTPDGDLATMEDHLEAAKKRGWTSGYSYRTKSKSVCWYCPTHKF